MTDISMGDEEVAAEAALPMFLEASEKAFGDRAKAKVMSNIAFTDEANFWTVQVLADFGEGDGRWRNACRCPYPFTQKKADETAQMLSQWIDEKLAELKQAPSP